MLLLLAIMAAGPALAAALRTAGRAAAEHLDDVADCGAGGRGDDPYCLRISWQRALASGGEEPLGFEAVFELLEGQRQFADTGGLDMGGVELVATGAFIDLSLIHI